MSALHSFTRNGVTVEIHHDPDCDSPRDDESNIGLFLGFPHRRYTIGDEQFDLGELAPESLEDVINFVKARYDARMVLTVSMTDHSGVSYYVGMPRDRWDSGVAGLIVATPEKIAELRPDVTDEELAAELAGEIEQYGMWANGECYGYVIVDPDGDPGDSCWGYIGWGDAEEAGKEAADYYRHPRVELPDDVLITL